MEVHVVIMRKCEDYHGCSDTIYNIYKDVEDAKKEVDSLTEENLDYNVDYFYETYKVN